MLIAGVGDIIAALVTQNRQLIGDSSEGSDVGPGDTIARVHLAVLRFCQQPPGNYGWNRVNPAFFQLSDYFDAVSNVEMDAKLLLDKFSRLLFAFSGCSVQKPNR